MPDSATKHQYLTAVLVVLLTAGLAGIASVYNRLIATEEAMSKRIDEVADKVLHKTVLDQRFSHLDYRINQIGKQCCSEVGETTGGL